MPELPEVELVAGHLNRLVKGRSIVSAEVLRARLIREMLPAEFSLRIQGSQIEAVKRRGKHILVELSSGQVLIVHLRMSGRFQLLPAEALLPRFAHLIFHLDDDTRLVFSDQRHFGMMKLISASMLFAAKELRHLAPEPFSDEFTPQYLSAALAHSRRSLKETLVDQRKITGLGNIYVAEVMFHARANPFSIAASFSPRRVPRLHRAILDVLEESLYHGSTLRVDPQNIDGSYYGGAYEGRWRVYDREGQPCHVCKRPIRRLMHAARSTYYCSYCQRR